MSINKADLVTIRGATQDDVSFIYATWLRGLRYGNDLFKEIPSNIYFEQYHKVITSVLQRPSTEIKIACLKEDPDVILGYSIIRGDSLDWVHVKSAWRNIGLAKSLLPSTIKKVTHITKIGLSILKKHSNIYFDPFSINSN